MSDRAPISRLVLAMIPDKNFTGGYRTNLFHFRNFQLGSVQITPQAKPVEATPIDVSSSHIKAYFTTMRAFGFEHGGNGTF